MALLEPRHPHAVRHVVPAEPRIVELLKGDKTFQSYEMNQPHTALTVQGLVIPRLREFAYCRKTHHDGAPDSRLPRPRDEVAESVLALSQRGVRHVRRQANHDDPDLEQLKEGLDLIQLDDTD